MDAILEQINSAGKTFVEFAVPMLVQSSVLIAILLLADFVLRKRVRAVFRYCVWMLVLVKLVLPATLSAPVSLGYLFGDRLANIEVSDTAAVVNSASVPQPAEVVPVGVSSKVPEATPTGGGTEPLTIEAAGPAAVAATPITWQGVVFLVWLAVVIAMGLLLVQRVIFVMGLVKQAKKANGLMNDALKYCRKCVGVKGEIGLKVSANATSPAVCGLFRPVILVPENLGPSLGAGHLRTVLMHELAHIKRGDLWVNLAQTVLQIIYFYNPLLWLANAIIRRVREQAVDETVQVVMGERANQYPEMLVDVAKLAFGRPALSLRLIGVVESKSTLQARVKRMLNRPIPKTAKLGLAGLLCVVILGCALLPMAKAAKSEEIAAESSKSQFIAKLANGVAVELVGVCEFDKGKVQKCWKPDGTLLETPFYVKEKPDIDNKAVGFLIKTDKPFSSIKWDISGATDHLGTSEVVDSNNEPTELYKNMQERLHLVKIESLFETEVKLSIGLPWSDATKYDGKYVIGQPDKRIRFIESYDSADGVKVVFQSDFEDREIRLDALVKGSAQSMRMAQITRATDTSGQKQNVAIFEDITLAQIRHFQLKTRLRMCFVTFKNVSLKPGFKTDVQIGVDNNEAAEDIRLRQGYGGQAEGTENSIGRINLPVGSKGAVTGEHGDAIYGSDIRYSPLMYLGRVRQGQELELMDNCVYYNEFTIPIIKVKVTSKLKAAVPTGTTGWVQLKGTNFAKAFEQKSDEKLPQHFKELSKELHKEADTNAQKYLSGEISLEELLKSLKPGIKEYKSRSQTRIENSENRTGQVEVEGAAGITAAGEVRSRSRRTRRSTRTGSSTPAVLPTTRPVVAPTMPDDAPMPAEGLTKEDIAAKLAIHDEQRSRVQRELNAAEGAVDDVRARCGFSDLEERSYPHQVTLRLNRLELERDNCILEIKQLQANILNLRRQQGEDATNDELKAKLRDSQDKLVGLQSKLEGLEEMRAEAAARKRELDLARVQYEQRAAIRDEKRRRLDELKLQIEKLRIMHDAPEARD